MPIRQSTQIRNSDTYNDVVTPSLANFETNPTNIEEDLNNLRSQVNNVLNNQNGNWYDNPFAGGGGAGGTNDIPVSGDPAVQVSLNSIPIACFADVLTDVTVPATQDYVILSVAGSEAPSQVGSLVNSTEGVIVAESANSGAAWENNELTERAGSSAIAPNNLVTIRDATTLQPIQSGGRDVFALIQVENGFTDGTNFTDVTPQRVKLSFVRINAAGDDLEAVPVADIENQVINYNYPFVRYFKNIDPSCFTGSRSFVDQAASVDVTLQNAYVGGNTITTSVANGNVTITGDQDFIVGGSVTVDFDTTSSISLDADVASNFTVDGDDLTLSTTTAGDVNVTAADALELQSLSGTINLGTDAVASTITVGNTTGATATSVVAGTGLNSISTTNAAAAGAVVRLDNGGVDFAFFAGTGTPNGVVTPTGIGDLYTETTTGQLWQNTDGLITGWVQFGSAAASTLEEVIENTGASPATLGGTSGPTTFEVQIQDLNTFSFESFAGDILIAMNAAASGDSVQIGHGGSDTLNVVSDTVSVVTGSYSMQSSSTFLVQGVSAGTVQTTGAGADLDVQTTGAGSALNLRTTNTTSVGSPVNISAADNSLGQGNNVIVTAGSQIGGLAPAGGGFVNIAAGNGFSSTVGGNVVVGAGAGGATGNGGLVNISGGTGGSTSGLGGNVTVAGGNANGGGEGGQATLTGGNGVGANNGGTAFVNGGDGGATGDGGPVSINGGDGGATSGQGGVINITAGDAPTSGNGGNINLTAGTGDAASNPGFIQLATTATNSDETDRVFRVNNAGTSGQTFDVFAGTSDPSGVVTALTGSLWVRDDSTTGEMYINTSAGGSGTTWELFQTGAGATTLQTAYENGNTIVTSAPEGPLDVSGTEAISLDAGAASNFSVAGDTLTLETTGAGNNTTLQSDAFVRVGSLDATGGAGGVAILTNGTTEQLPGIGFNTLPTDTNSATVGAFSGTVSGTGSSGFVGLGSGAASGSGSSGPVQITTGQNTGTGTSGPMTIATGGAAGNASGALSISTGGGGTASGNIDVFTNNADDAGDVLITTGDSDGFAGGAVQIFTGDATSGNHEGGGIQVVQGNGSGVSQGGSTSWQTGNGGATGDGGQYTVSTGNGGATSGDGGDVQFFPGDATTSGIGGSFGVTCGNGAAAGEGGTFSASAGDGGATGNGGSAALSAGDGGVTSGNGGNVNLTAGSAITLGDGGNVNIIAGASDATGTPGSVLISTAGVNLDEEDRIARFRNQGTNGETFDVYSGTSDPSGVVTALTGSLWVRDDNTTGELYINTSAGGTGTTWEQLQAGGGNSLQQAYVAGNTIVTDAANGDIDFSGTERFDVFMEAGVTIQTANTVASTGNTNLRTGDSSGGVSGNMDIETGDGATLTGNIVMQTGDNTGTGNTGFVSISTGQAPDDSGAITISTGLAGSNAGDINLSVGSSGGVGGDVNITAGDTTSVTPLINAGNVLITAGGKAAAGGANAGEVAISGGPGNAFGSGGDVEIGGGSGTSGGSVGIQGGIPTSGDGGNVSIEGTNAVGTGDGGDVTIVPGGGAGGGNDGIVSIDSELDNTSPIFRLDNAGGANGNVIDQFVSEVAPEGVITAPAGSITFVDDGGTDTDGQLWLKTSGTGNTGWEQLSTASGSRPSIGQAEPGATPANTPILLSGLTDLGGGTIPSSVPTGASFVERVRVFINGVLQISSNVNGSTTSPRTVAASTDTVLGDAIELSFALFAGDILTLEVYPA